MSDVPRVNSKRSSDLRIPQACLPCGQKQMKNRRLKLSQRVLGLLVDRGIKFHCYTSLRTSSGSIGVNFRHYTSGSQRFHKVVCNSRCKQRRNCVSYVTKSLRHVPDEIET